MNDVNLIFLELTCSDGQIIYLVQHRNLKVLIEVSKYYLNMKHFYLITVGLLNKSAHGSIGEGISEKSGTPLSTEKLASS